jgi:hypothetical protein
VPKLRPLDPRYLTAVEPSGASAGLMQSWIK